MADLQNKFISRLLGNSLAKHMMQAIQDELSIFPENVPADQPDTWKVRFATFFIILLRQNTMDAIPDDLLDRILEGKVTGADIKLEGVKPLMESVEAYREYLLGL